MIGAVAPELVGADSGLGYAMMTATADLNIARLFAVIIILSGNTVVISSPASG